MNAKQKRDMYQEITDKVLELMQEHGSDWVRPWVENKAGCPYNAAKENYYRGTNVFWLLLSAMIHGYRTNAWATFDQWQNMGDRVKKGERSEVVIFYKKRTIKEWNDDNGEYDVKQIPLLRTFPVFNADQVEGYEPEELHIPPTHPEEAIQMAECWVENTEAKFITGDSPCYVPSVDGIMIPPRESFKSVHGYYATAFHELTHWSGHKSRCDRNMKSRFGDEAYAMEELIAEIGSAFQCVHTCVTYEPHEDHAKYINHWIKRLGNDKKAFITAASKAQEAFDYIESLQPVEMEEMAYG